MATDHAENTRLPEPGQPEPGQRRCPVCWTRFTPNSPNNPHPRRYCCGACRIEDSRRRREREQTQLLLAADLEAIRTINGTDDERRDAAQARRLLNEWRRAP
ncbi:MAG: hypothetical protein ACRDQB_11370 [Thermocrispum sp.]